MNERILELLIRAKNAAGPGIKSAKTAMRKFSARVKSELRGIRNVSKRVSNAFRQNWLLVAASIALVAVAIKKVIGLMKSWGITASSTVENLRIRMTAALRSVEEGNKLFAKMEKLAGKVAFEYREIIEGATALSAVLKDGREEVEKYMPIILDLAAFSGLAIQDVISNFIKMYSSGAAAADMFRDRGILAMLGFQAGVSYTAKETMDKVIEGWESADSKFRDLSKKLGGTWTGLMSMMADRMFVFKKMIGEAGFFGEIKLQMQSLLQLIDNLKERGKLDEWAKSISDAFIKMLDVGQDMIITMIVGAAQIVDAWNEVRVIFDLVRIGWAEFTKIFPGVFSKKVREELTESIKEWRESLEDAVMAAETDFSEKMVTAVNKFKEALAEAREEVEAIQEVKPNLEAFDEATKKTGIMKEAFAGLKSGLSKILEETFTVMEAMETLFAQTAKNMMSAFSDYFFKLFTGEVVTAKEIFAEFGRSMARTISDILAKWLVMQAITGIAGVFKGGGDTTGGGTVRVHQGGIVRRAHSGLANDEVPIIAQTGERVLSRKETNVYNSRETGGQVSHTYIINAVDPRSFADLLRQHPGIIAEVVDKGIRSNTGLRRTMQRYT